MNSQQIIEWFQREGKIHNDEIYALFKKDEKLYNKIHNMKTCNRLRQEGDYWRLSKTPIGWKKVWIEHHKH